MKIGVVGAGQVGSTSAYALVMRGVGREVVIVDVDQARAAAQAEDVLHAVPFAHPLQVRAGGYGDLSGASVVVIAAGASQGPGESRPELLGRNVAVFQQVIPSVLEYAPDAVLVIATNPVDALTHFADKIAREAGAPAGRVLGTGTTLDTARFRTLIAARVGVDAEHVHAYVLGEHGDSEVLCWSSATVASMPLAEFCLTRGYELDDRVRREVDDAVRNAAARIIAGKGATYYGVAAAIATICDSIVSDRRSVLTLCARTPAVAGVEDVTVSLPRLLGGAGILDTFAPAMCAEESDAMHVSALAVAEMIAEFSVT